jgi:hypothetical protein
MEVQLQSFLTYGDGWRGPVSWVPWPHYPKESVHQTGCLMGPTANVETVVKTKISAHVGNWTPSLQSSTPSLYWSRYPTHHTTNNNLFFIYKAGRWVWRLVPEIMDTPCTTKKSVESSLHIPCILFCPVSKIYWLFLNLHSSSDEVFNTIYSELSHDVEVHFNNFWQKPFTSVLLALQFFLKCYINS